MTYISPKQDQNNSLPTFLVSQREMWYWACLYFTLQTELSFIFFYFFQPFLFHLLFDVRSDCLFFMIQVCKAFQNISQSLWVCYLIGQLGCNCFTTSRWHPQLYYRIYSIKRCPQINAAFQGRNINKRRPPLNKLKLQIKSSSLSKPKKITFLDRNNVLILLYPKLKRL